jgi:hypothetical protein
MNTFVLIILLAANQVAASRLTLELTPHPKNSTLLGATPTLPIENVFNIAYLGTMFFGPDSNLQGVNTPTFVYDTNFKGVAVTTT